MELKNEVELELSENLLSDDLKYYDKEVAINHEMNDIKESLEHNIENRIEKLKENSSVFEKINKGQIKTILESGIEAALKSVLKKKLKINYSTFNDFKDGISAIMDGNVKEFIKKGTDSALDIAPIGNATIKSTIKSVKNAVLDNVINDEKYNIINRQTKVLNKLSKHCAEFDDAMNKDNVTAIKNKANAIKKDMKEIMPIYEIIHHAQVALDKYELWKNKGEIKLTEEENNLIESLNKSA